MNRQTEFHYRALIKSIVAALAICWLTGIPAMSASTSTVGGDKIIRQAGDAEMVTFVLTLQLRDRGALDQENADIYDPKSANFHHFLSSEEFEEKYAPTETTYAALKAFATRSGLTILSEQPGRTLLDVSGSVAIIRALFKTQMYWRETSDGVQYLSSDKEPSPPPELSSIGGNAALLKQKPTRPPGRNGRLNPSPGAGSGATGS